MRVRSIDLLAVGVAFTLLAFWAIARVGVGAKAASETECPYNLKVLYHQYSSYVDIHGRYVTDLSTNVGGTKEVSGDPSKIVYHFRELFLDGPPYKELVCPEDSRSPALTRESLRSTNVSYFLTLNPPKEQGRWVLAGNRNILDRGEVIVVLGRDRVSWYPRVGLHKDRGYLAFADGSVELFGTNQLRDLVAAPLNGTNRIILP